LTLRWSGWRRWSAAHGNQTTSISKQPLPAGGGGLELKAKLHSSELEKCPVAHIQKFLPELGQGFAFVGRQVQLAFASRDYFLDLLFYHLKRRCYVVIELKAVPFDPAFIGQINVYLSAVDDLLRHPGDKPTIGLLLCRSKDRIVVEYALRDLKKPIGVAGWETKIVEQLLENLKGSLPTVEELEAELSREETGR
jgi:hypothetical protein